MNFEICTFYYTYLIICISLVHNFNWRFKEKNLCWNIPTTYVYCMTNFSFSRMSSFSHICICSLPFFYRPYALIKNVSVFFIVSLTFETKKEKKLQINDKKASVCVYLFYNVRHWDKNHRRKKQKSNFRISGLCSN